MACVCGVVGVIWENIRLMAQVDAAALRELLYAPLVSGTHKDITERFADLGLEESAGAQGSKAERVHNVLEGTSGDGLAAAAERLLAAGGIGAGLRNRIQDVLWDGRGPVIWERTRRNLAAVLDIEDLVVDPDRFEKMLDRWWVLGSTSPFEGIFDEGDSSTLTDLLGPASGSVVLRKEIDRHVFEIRTGQRSGCSTSLARSTPSTGGSRGF